MIINIDLKFLKIITLNSKFQSIQTDTFHFAVFINNTKERWFSCRVYLFGIQPTENNFWTEHTSTKTFFHPVLFLLVFKGYCQTQIILAYCQRSTLGRKLHSTFRDLTPLVLLPASFPFGHLTHTHIPQQC